MSERQHFQIGQIPRALLEEAARCVDPYATALGWPHQHVGSGTFARINGRPGILTAHHVWEAIYRERDRYPEVHLLVARDDHRYTVPVHHLVVHLRLARDSEAWGPDLQFIEVPALVASRIAVAKSFVEISARAEKWKKIAHQAAGFAFVAGFAAVETIASPSGNVNEPNVLLRGGYVTGVDRLVKNGKFDYLETTVDYEFAKDLPETFGGVSGGGLWRFSLRQGDRCNDMTTATLSSDFALAGVAFYEERSSDSKMTLRYHGPDSIYEILPTLVPAYP